MLLQCENLYKRHTKSLFFRLISCQVLLILTFSNNFCFNLLVTSLHICTICFYINLSALQIFDPIALVSRLICELIISHTLEVIHLIRALIS